MTEKEKMAEIAAMVKERNALRQELICLENKRDRIKKALAEIKAALAGEQKIQVVRDEGIVAGANGTKLPHINEIMDTQNRILDTKERLIVLNERIDAV